MGRAFQGFLQGVLPVSTQPGAAYLIPHGDLLLNKIDSGFPEFPRGQGTGQGSLE